jgi:para-aminobenzoate synthetase component 1
MNDAPPQIPPVCCHLLDELPLKPPFWRYYEIYRDAPYSFFLDSAKQSERLGLYSFIGGDPTLIYRAKRRKTDIGGKGAEKTPSNPNLSLFAAEIEIIEPVDPLGRRLEEPKFTRRLALPFEDLRRVLAAHRVDYGKYAGHPVPFLSGAVGYFAYEAAHFIEELPDRGADDLRLPDIYLMFVSTVLAYCHRAGRAYLSVLGRGVNEKAAREQAETLRGKMLARLNDFESSAISDKNPHPNPLPKGEGTQYQHDHFPKGEGTQYQHDHFPKGEGTQYYPVDLAKGEGTCLNHPHPNPLPKGEGTIDIRGQLDRAEYCRKIETIKGHIRAGDVYQVCLTRRLDAPLIGGAAWDLYRELRGINPAPFAAFLNFPETQIVSSSPERFLSLDADGMAESRPIKGTRPRGATLEEDNRLRLELSASPKDRAENLMIVDLVRNDFGRVCRFGSVVVPEFMSIEDYATVFQMVSTVRGRLAEGRDGLDLLRACFPGGSMTGAPKIEAMKIIGRLEPVNRGVYSGAVGYLDFAGPMDLSIVIRTILVKDGRCYFHAGGGIVADSDPSAEFQETQDKARALVQAIKNLSITFV